MKEVDTEDSLGWWVNKAKKGEKVMYFDGFLLYERQVLINNGVMRDQFPQRLKTAIMAWKLYLDGVLTLVQRKRDHNQYEYIAIKR